MHKHVLNQSQSRCKTCCKLARLSRQGRLLLLLLLPLCTSTTPAHMCAQPLRINDGTQMVYTCVQLAVFVHHNVVKLVDALRLLPACAHRQGGATLGMHQQQQTSMAPKMSSAGSKLTHGICHTSADQDTVSVWSSVVCMCVCAHARVSAGVCAHRAVCTRVRSLSIGSVFRAASRCTSCASLSATRNTPTTPGSSCRTVAAPCTASRAAAICSTCC